MQLPVNVISLVLTISTCDYVNSEVLKTKVAILGGGMAGTIAARTLAEANLSDFVIVEARHELGGRMMSAEFAGQTVELGANWIQGTRNNVTGESNPIWELALKYNLSNVLSDYDDLLYFNESGPVEGDPDVDAIFENYEVSFTRYSAAAGYRLSKGLVDQTVKTGLTLHNWTARTPAEQAVEWWEFDWEYGQRPDLTSWVEAVNNFNYTFLDWSEDNMFVTDKRGLKVLLHEEAKGFLEPGQVLFNTTVSTLAWSATGVNITASHSNGTSYTIKAEYVIVTFSIGVLKHDASTLFTPPLPDWKTESIQAFAISTYTKIFLSFPQKFWNDSQYSLYIHPHVRGRYAIWQDLTLPDFLPEANITFVTVSAEQSYEVEAQPEETTKSEILEILSKMYPNVEIPEPNGFLLPKWHSDPLFRGCYSNWPSGYPKALHDQLRASVGGGRVVFSGEATSYKYYGFMQGAYYEGIRAAKEVLQFIDGVTVDFGTGNLLTGCNGL